MGYGYKVTTNGRAILAACLAAQKPLVLTRVAMGSGVVPEGVDLADMHELVSYVVDGYIGERIHNGDTLHLTAQYENEKNPSTGMFYLSEFMIYVSDPESGEDRDFIYATLGEYRQPVPAYAPTQPPSVWKFPLTLIVSDEIEVSFTGAAGLVTYDDLQKAVENAYAKMIEEFPTGGIKKCFLTNIPSDGWVEDPEKANGYGYYYDIVDPVIRSNMKPKIVIAEECLETAANAGMCVTATTYHGYVRVKSVQPPSDDMTVDCELYVIGQLEPTVVSVPPASSTTVGGVIVEEGSGLKVDEMGRISIDAASDDEVSDAIDDAFEGADGGGNPGGDDYDGPTEDDIPEGYEVASDEEVSDAIEGIFGS